VLNTTLPISFEAEMAGIDSWCVFGSEKYFRFLVESSKSLPDSMKEETFKKESLGTYSHFLY